MKYPAHLWQMIHITDAVVVSDPIIATLISSDDKAWLYIGAVNGLKIYGKPANYAGLDILTEEKVTVSYQILGLRPATSEDDPELLHDWRTCRIEEQSFTVPGQLIQP